MDVLKNVYVTPVIPTERSEWRDLVQNSEPFLTRQRRLYSDALARKISPLGGLSALLGRNDKVDIIFRDPFDCAEKTGLPKIAAKRDFWEEEEPPCKSSILPFGKMLTA